MANSDQYNSTESGTNVTVTVDVTRIVKYVCVAGIFIVGIIFGTKCYHRMMEEGLFKL